MGDGAAIVRIRSHFVVPMCRRKPARGVLGEILYQEKLMCPLCIATSTLVLASAGSAGGLGAIATKILRQKNSKKANAGPVARSGIVPAKTA